MTKETDYLWDKSGEPDPEIVRLERALARYRYEPDARALAPRAQPTRRRVFAIAAAAAAAAAIAFAWLRLASGPAGGYRVVGIDGRARVRAGDELATGHGARGHVEIAGLGHVELAPSTRLKVEDCGVAAHRLYLERGTVHARIFASPRQFQIGTPSGLTVDLGCEYSLDVDDAGRSVLRVESGQVAFEFEGRSVYVPAGATCVARPVTGPSIPVFDDASEAFRAALVALEDGARGGAPDAAADALFDGRREDTLTLWHLFDSPRTDPALRERCFRALSRMFPKPAGASDEGLRAGDRAMRDAWMDAMKPSWKVE